MLEAVKPDDFVPKFATSELSKNEKEEPEVVKQNGGKLYYALRNLIFNTSSFLSRRFKLYRDKLYMSNKNKNK